MNDPDGPQEIDLDRDDDEEYTIDCPMCGRPFHEDAVRCPYCGHFAIEETPAMRRARGWFWPVLVALLVGIILVMWAGLRF